MGIGGVPGREGAPNVDALEGTDRSSNADWEGSFVCLDVDSLTRRT